MTAINYIPELADGVCSVLNAARDAGAFNIPFGGAQRTYEPEFRVEESERSGLVIAVMAREADSETVNRGIDKDEIGVDVGVWMHVADRRVETIDPLMLFVRTLWNVLRTNIPLASGGYGSYLRRVCKPIYDPALLKQNIFLSVTTFTFHHNHAP